MQTQRAYNGPGQPCNLTDRNLGTITALPTCCLYHREDARDARIATRGCACNPARPHATYCVSH